MISASENPWEVYDVLRRYSTGDLDVFLRQAMGSVARVGGGAYYAESSEDARRIVGGGKVVVKGKSMISEEIGIDEYLV